MIHPLKSIKVKPWLIINHGLLWSYPANSDNVILKWYPPELNSLFRCLLIQGWSHTTTKACKQFFIVEVETTIFLYQYVIKPCILMYIDTLPLNQWHLLAAPMRPGTILKRRRQKFHGHPSAKRQEIQGQDATWCGSVLGQVKNAVYATRG